MVQQSWDNDPPGYPQPGAKLTRKRVWTLETWATYEKIQHRPNTIEVILHPPSIKDDQELRKDKHTYKKIEPGTLKPFWLEKSKESKLLGWFRTSCLRHQRVYSWEEGYIEVSGKQECLGEEGKLLGLKMGEQ